MFGHHHPFPFGLARSDASVRAFARVNHLPVLAEHGEIPDGCGKRISFLLPPIYGYLWLPVALSTSKLITRVPYASLGCTIQFLRIIPPCYFPVLISMPFDTSINPAKVHCIHAIFHQVPFRNCRCTSILLEQGYRGWSERLRVPLSVANLLTAPP